MKSLRPFAAAGLSLLFTAVVADAANITSSQTGNWDVGTTWVGGVSPVAGDNVTIASSHVITVAVNAAAAAVTISANTTGTNGLIINSGILLDVSGAITMTAPTAGTSTINVGAGTLQAASIAIPGSATAGRNCAVSVSTGTITTTGSITFSGTAAQAQFTSTGASTVNVAGNFGSGGTLTTSGTGTINFNGGAAQTLGTYTTYNNITINNTSGGVTLTGTTTIGGALTVTTGALTVGAFTFTVTGASSVGGTLSITSATGTKTFTGNVTINNGGTWDNTSGNEAVSLAGNLQNDGTFSAGTGVYTFTGTTKTVSGANAVSIPNLTVNGTVTNNGTLTVATALEGSGAMTNGVNASLNIGGTSGISTLTSTANPNTLTYNGAAQSIVTTTCHHLVLAGSGVKTPTGGNPMTCNGDLTFSGTASMTSSVGVTVSGNFTVNNGATLTIAGFSFSCTGATSVSGTLAFSSTASTKTFGNITVNDGGLMSFSAAEGLTVNGNLQVNGSGTISGTQGTWTFQKSGGGGTLSGTASAITLTNATFTTSYAVSIPCTISSTLTVTGTTLTNNTTLTASSALSGTGGLTQGTDATLNIGGTSGITTLTASANPNTVNYNGAAQTVRAITYHHLTLAGSGTMTMPASTLTLNGNFTMSGTCSATAAAAINTAGNFTVGGTNAFTTGSFTHDVKGNFSNSGTFTATGSTITLTGTADEAIGGTVTTTFNHLTVNKASASVTVSTTFNVSGTLTFTSGNISTGANKVVITSTGTVSRTSGHVVGNLEKNVVTGSSVSRTFEIGSASTYTPVDVVFASVSVAGDLIASTASGDHPNIASSDVNPVKSVNRYWTLTVTGGLVFTSYDATFHFVAGDVDAGATTSTFVARRYSGGTWSLLTMGTQTATSTQITGATAVGDFQMGNVLSVAVSNSVFTFGTQLLNIWLAAQSSIITNDGTEIETIIAQISIFTAGANTWLLSAVANGADQVRAQWSTASNTGPWNDISAYATNFTLSSSLAAGGTVTLYFRIQTPTSTSSNNQYSSNLTVTAQ